MATDVLELPRTTRVTLVRDEFLSEYDGRLKAGTVVLVDERTARRWLDKGIAVPSEQTDKTQLEQKIAQLARLQAEIEAIGNPGSDHESISRAGGVEAQREIRRGRAS